MPIVPNLIERLILFRLNLGPGLVLDLFGGFAFRAAAVAARPGVFLAPERTLLQPLEYLEESIRKGEPSFDNYERYAEMDRSWWRDQQDAMIAVARMVGDDIVARVKLPETARRL